MINRILLTALLAVFIISSDVQAKLYIWTDEKGVTHFSNQTPPRNQRRSPQPAEPEDRKTGGVTPKKSPENRIRVPGTRVALVPPPGFVPAERFPGFARQESNSSILISEMPVPYAEVIKGFTEAGLLSRGMKLVEQSKATLCGKAGLILNLIQTAAGSRWEKWVLVFGDQNETVMLTAVFPQQFQTELSNPMRASLLSTRCVSGTDRNPLEGLTFSLSSTPKMTFAKRFGNSIIMTRDGSFPAKNKPSASWL